MNARVFAIVAAVALLAAGAIAAMHALTRDRIAAQERHAQRAAMAIVLPAASFDNDPLHEMISLHAPHWLGSDAPLRAWRARKGGAHAALVLETVAPDGYAAPIRLLVGIDADGRVLGVRITQHRETPGLGDWIEARKSDWINAFKGTSLASPPRDRWKVKRDGGDFDQFAGATVTPRAVVHAVKRTLDYVARHGDELAAAPAGSTLDHADAPDP